MNENEKWTRKDVAQAVGISYDQVRKNEEKLGLSLPPIKVTIGRVVLYNRELATKVLKEKGLLR